MNLCATQQNDKLFKFETQHGTRNSTSVINTMFNEEIVGFVRRVSFLYCSSGRRVLRSVDVVGDDELERSAEKEMIISVRR